MYKCASVVVTLLCRCKTEDSTITVPVPNYEELRIGTLRSIIRQSGLPRALFEVT
ncbi:MAG: type II toxin-antitoxin system HicA family toxin [Nostoc sp.]